MSYRFLMEGQVKQPTLIDSYSLVTIVITVSQKQHLQLETILQLQMEMEALRLNHKIQLIVRRLQAQKVS